MISLFSVDSQQIKFKILQYFLDISVALHCEAAMTACQSLPILGLVVIALLYPAAGKADAPTPYECEVNQKAASAAVDAAIQSKHDVDKAAAGLMVGGTCGVVLLSTAWFDFGVSTLICAVATAAAVQMTPAEANAGVAQEAYRAVRDPRCVKQ
jgi:hypothetical protein